MANKAEYGDPRITIRVPTALVRLVDNYGLTRSDFFRRAAWRYLDAHKPSRRKDRTPVVDRAMARAATISHPVPGDPAEPLYRAILTMDAEWVDNHLSGIGRTADEATGKLRKRVKRFVEAWPEYAEQAFPEPLRNGETDQ